MGCVNIDWKMMPSVKHYSTGDHNMVSNIFDMPSPTDITCQHQYEKAEKKNRFPFDSLLHFTHDNVRFDNRVVLDANQ